MQPLCVGHFACRSRTGHYPFFYVYEQSICETMLREYKCSACLAIRLVVCAALTREGMQVTEASDGSEALELLKNSSFTL